MFGHGIDIAAQAFERPVPRAVGVGHGLQGGEGFRGDDKKGFGGIEIVDGFGEIGAIDVGNEPEGHRAVAVMLECFVGHDRSEVGAADADVDHVANPFAGVALPVSAPDPVGEVGHFVEHCMNLRDHVFAVDDDGGPLGGAQRHVQNRPVFRDIDLLAVEHGIDPISQTAFFRQLKEQFEGFIGDAIFRVIEIETHCLDGQTLAALGVIRKELSKMKISDLLMVSLEGLPSRAPGK